MAKKKYYAVRKGKETGIFYDTWDVVNARCILGFSGAEFRGFSTEAQANEYMNNAQEEIIEKDVPKETPIIYVDGSFMNDNIGYGVVYTRGQEVILKDAGRVVLSASVLNQMQEECTGKDPRNIAGEIYGAIRAMQMGIANGEKEIIIAYDYIGVERWATNSFKKAKSAYAKRYIEYYNSVKDRISIKFLKIDSHTGHKFNDMADEMAKLGTTL